MTTHPTTATATTPCPQCAALRRALSRLEGRVDILTWTVRRLAEYLDQPRLAALLADTADTDAEDEEPD